MERMVRKELGWVGCLNMEFLADHRKLHPVVVQTLYLSGQ